MTPTRRTFLATAGSTVTLATAGCLQSGPDPAAKVDEHRSTLETYGDVATAMDREYRTLARYVQSDAGVLGETLLARSPGSPSPETPHAVTFDLTEDGAYEPLALKWFVPATEVDSAPSLFGRSFDGPIEPSHGLLPRHYYLHVWLFRENPDGLFARYNPDVQPPSYIGTVDRARSALDVYARSKKAVQDGYGNPETCAKDRSDAAYGVPFVKDPGGGMALEDPPILRYRLTSNWSYLLLGAEWFRPADAVDSPPSMFGQSFHEPMPGHLEKTGQPRHYGLHAWLFRSNPNGMFAPYNPAITC
ncbi:MAG: hypothetical protein ABEJ05_05730 [Haloglomus sp.]